MKITLTESAPGHWGIEVAPTTEAEQGKLPTVLEITQALHAVQGDLMRQLLVQEKERSAKGEAKIIVPEFPGPV